MNRTTVLDAALHAAGIPIVGLSGSGPNCRVDFAESATDEQRSAAAALLAAFDWSEPPPPRPAKTLESLYMSTPLEARLPVWAALGEWAMARLISREVQADPDGAQAILDKLRSDKVIEFDVRIREEK